MRCEEQSCAIIRSDTKRAEQGLPLRTHNHARNKRAFAWVNSPSKQAIPIQKHMPQSTNARHIVT